MSDISKEERIEIGTQLLVQSLSYLLKDYEGIILHLDGEGYCLWKDPNGSRIEVVQDDEYLTVESGRMVWMYDETPTAPAPEPGDDIIGDIPTKIDPKKLN